MNEVGVWLGRVGEKFEMTRSAELTDRPQGYA